MGFIRNDAMDASEFVAMLSPTNGWFPGHADTVSQVYRGHSSGRYHLQSSALRDARVLRSIVPSWQVGNLTIPRPTEGDTYSTQVTLEYLSLRRFFDEANSHALPLPDYTAIKAFFDESFPWRISDFQSASTSVTVLPE